MENKKNYLNKFVVITIVAVILILGGFFMIYYDKPKDVVKYDVHGGSLELTYSDETNLFTIENAVPTSDMVGMKYDVADLYFDFTVKTILDEAEKVDYQIVLLKSDISTIPLESMKFYLEKEVDGTYVKVSDPIMITEDDGKDDSSITIYKNSRNSTGNDNYRLRMWAADTSALNSNNNEKFAVSVSLKGKAN